MEDVYSSGNFISLSALEKLGGDFSALGFLWVLRDVLGGKSEGLVNLKALAESSGVNIRDIYGYIGVLEDSFIISTRAETEGRRIKFLTVPAVQEASCFAQECSDFITDYLRQHNVIPGKSSYLQEENAVLSRTALNLGNNFALLSGFYSAMKSTLNDRREFTYSLSDNNIILNDTTKITGLANGLNLLGFFSSYVYKKSPQRTITAKVAYVPEAHKFISGGWLEEWVYCRVVQLLTGGYACVRNLNVMLPGGENFEFDLLICSRGNIFWVEAKTAKYPSFVPKYSRIASLLGLPADNAILVAPDAPIRATQQGITCCNLEGFPEVFAISLKACTP